MVISFKMYREIEKDLNLSTVVAEINFAVSTKMAPNYDVIGKKRTNSLLLDFTIGYKADMLYN
jgi:hypothetical protein